MLYNVGGMSAETKEQAINIYKIFVHLYKSTLSLDDLDSIVKAEKTLSEVFGVTEDEMTKIKGETR